MFFKEHSMHLRSLKNILSCDTIIAKQGKPSISFYVANINTQF